MIYIPNPIALTFDLQDACEDVRTIFERKIARTLWLAWKSTHVTSQYFNFAVWKAAEELECCMPPIIYTDLTDTLRDEEFQSHDLEEWCVAAAPYFSDKELKYFEPYKRTIAPNADAFIKFDGSFKKWQDGIVIGGND